MPINNIPGKIPYAYQDNNMVFRRGEDDVGIQMEAKLDKTSTLPGKNTSIAPSRLMNIMKSLKFNYQSETFIRGHLLNAELGGTTDASNLFPITSQANSEHSQNVEKKVKDMVLDKDGQYSKQINPYVPSIPFFPITYEVKIDGSNGQCYEYGKKEIHCRVTSNNAILYKFPPIISEPKGRNIFVDTLSTQVKANNSADQDTLGFLMIFDRVNKLLEVSNEIATKKSFLKMHSVSYNNNELHNNIVSVYGNLEKYLLP